MAQLKIFQPYKLGSIELSNRIVMAPMTRSRSIGNVPNSLVETYYGQRASAGLIITEGVSPSPYGLGYARIPGIFDATQTAAWKPVTEAVHNKGGHIFMQLMHTGRIAVQQNLPSTGKVVAPSAVQAKGEMWTDQFGMQPHPVPEAMASELLKSTIQEFAQAAKNAISAGFDGIELHSANGYLLEQFISPFSNQRDDEYGGTIENRIRFIIETAQAVSDAIGKDRVGIRLSPYGVFNDMPHYAEIDETYTKLAAALAKIGIAYIHIVDHSSGGAPFVPDSIKDAIKLSFGGTIILSGGYQLQTAEAALKSNLGDLVAFGKPFINNPDLVDRFQNEFPLSQDLDMATFYTPGEKGYTDYPAFSKKINLQGAN